MNKIIACLLLFLFCSLGYSQNYSSMSYVDSLKSVLEKSEKTDTTYVFLLNTIGQHTPIFRQSYWDTLINVVDDQLKNSPTKNEEYALLKYKSGALGNIGYINDNLGNISTAIEYHERSLEIDQSIDNKEGIGATNINLGFIYHNQGNIKKALELYNNALKIYGGIGNDFGIASVFVNIGNLYDEQGDRESALKCHKKALNYFQKLEDNRGILSACIGIGFIYDHLEEFDSSLFYYHKSRSISERIGNKVGMADSYSNIAAVHETIDDIDSAIFYIEKTLELDRASGNKRSLSSSHVNLGWILFEQGEIAKAKSNFITAYDYAKQVGSPHHMEKPTLYLSMVYKQEKNYKEALEMYELHIQMRDSLKNSETQKATIRQQTQYEFEKAQIVKEQEEKELARQELEETSRRNNLQYSMIFLGILLFFGIVLSLGFIKVSPTVAEGLIFFAFLILFEFLLVLADPYVDGLTSGEPIYKLFANAVLAGAIFPAHAFFERALKKRIVKN